MDALARRHELRPRVPDLPYSTEEAAGRLQVRALARLAGVLPEEASLEG